MKLSQAQSHFVGLVIVTFVFGLYYYYIPSGTNNTYTFFLYFPLTASIMTSLGPPQFNVWSSLFIGLIVGAVTIYGILTIFTLLGMNPKAGRLRA
jgi:hypothetical protein